MYHTKRKTNKTLNIIIALCFISLLFAAIHTNEWAAFFVLILFYGIYIIYYYTESYIIDNDGNIIIKTIYHTSKLTNIERVENHNNILKVTHDNGCCTEINPTNSKKFLIKMKEHNIAVDKIKKTDE